MARIAPTTVLKSTMVSLDRYGSDNFSLFKPLPLQDCFVHSLKCSAPFCHSAISNQLCLGPIRVIGAIMSHRAAKQLPCHGFIQRQVGPLNMQYTPFADGLSLTP
jgi:hypothetical protein